MTWDVIVFECKGLWDMIGNGAPYQLAKFLKLGRGETNMISYSFPDKCDFHDMFLFTANKKLDPIEVYKFARDNEIELVVVPSTWGPPIDRNEMLRFLDKIERI